MLQALVTAVRVSVDCPFKAPVSGLCDVFSVYCGVEVGKGKFASVT